ncbi:fimbrial biogenesis usher protein [Lelliottia sp.]|uniref:fimbrial biogenesis usher protein n=1 Tax=Lelliottia sp. TaxID=1898429 RepID=UPI00388FC0CF
MSTNRRSNPFKLSQLCIVILILALPVAKSRAEGTTNGFDIETLKNRGLDSALGKYFADSAKFMPGRHPLALHVNGNDRGTVTARFGSQGQLCVDRDFLNSAGLNVPSGLGESAPDQADAQPASEECYDYQKDYPTAVITPLPGEERLDIVVPEEALAMSDKAQIPYVTGGTAGLFNYTLFSTHNDSSSDSSTYSQAALEEGLNFSDWMIRSRQVVTKEDDAFNSESLYTYAQHTFVEQKAIVQAGQINISNTLFSGSSISGIQMIPETALTGSDESGVTVRGLARGPQARVEVRQAGALVYSTLVPMGPFVLNNVPITSVNTSLEVTVKETDGKENHFIIPAQALRPNQLGGPQGLSLAIGKLRDIGDEYDKATPVLLTASKGWKLQRWMNVSAGGLVTEKYTGLATSVDVAPMKNTVVSMTLKESQDKQNGNTGSNAILNASYSATEHLSVSGAVSRYSAGYRELGDTLQDDFSQYTGQYSANINWSNETLGSFSLGYNLSEGANGEDDSKSVSLSWGKTFSRVNVSVNVQNQLNHESDNSHRSNEGAQVYVNLSVPLGSQRVGAYWRKQGESQSAGLQTSGNVNPEMSYAISADRDLTSHENSFNGSLSDNLHYAQLGLNAGTNGPDSKNYGATLSGGVLAHSEGVTFSPYAIGDTFALVSLGDKISNVEISTPSGDVWTDRWGHAVVASLPAYQSSRIEINTETLPKNIDVNNGTSMVSEGHGAVSQVKFGVLNVRRGMLRVKPSANNMMKKGSSIVDEKGNYIATAIDDGMVFLTDLDNLPTLYVTDEKGQKQCQLHYSLAKERDLNAFYENITGVCQ